jgi:hypothetical protein
LEDINLSTKYSSTVTFAGSCGADEIISFDYLGRPLLHSLDAATTPYPTGQLMTLPCNITLSDGTENAVIQIRPETGYASILP